MKNEEGLSQIGFELRLTTDARHDKGARSRAAIAALYL